MKKNFLLMLLLLLSFGCHGIPNIESSQAYRVSEKTWKDFRGVFKYSYQTIGVEFLQPDSSYNILISEPPERVSIEDIKALIKNYNYILSVKQHQIGYDGWIKDAVVSINGISKSSLDSIIKNLNKILFATDYKSHCISLPLKFETVSFITGNLNYRITPAELNDWFMKKNEKFHYLSDSSYHTIKSIFQKRKGGVLYSKVPGFVIWVIPVGTDISNQKAEIRQFTLDADLILGAISDGIYTAIIGRERVNDIYDLPPLQPETVILLAAANKKALEQSYERNCLTAGKLSNNDDWAPIYLSRELHNTEYGNLLNMTDQMLKSWSENGYINYNRFDYLHPDHWAFEYGVQNEFNTPSIVYNWNTNGAVYKLYIDDSYSILALNRTGSLPVTYKPDAYTGNGIGDSLVMECEQKGYDFFSGLNNPYLIRVEQYSALYQIFSEYNIKANIPIHGRNDNFDFFKKYIIRKFEKIRDLDDAQIDSLSVNIYEIVREINENQIIGYLEPQLSALNDSSEKLIRAFLDSYKQNLDTLTSLLNDIPVDSAKAQRLKKEEKVKKIFINDVKDTIYELKKAVKKIYAHLSQDETDTFFRYAANPNEFDLSDIFTVELQECLELFFQTKEDLELFNNNHEFFYGKSLEDIRDEYIDSNIQDSGRWIKTPSVVQSWRTGDSLTCTGGHNIDTKVIHIFLDKHVQEDHYELYDLSGIRVAVFNPADINRITAKTINEITSIKETAEILYKIPQDWPDKIRSRSELVPYRIIQMDERGCISKEHIFINKLNQGYTINGKNVTKRSKLNSELKNIIKGNPDVIFQVHYDENLSENEVTATVHCLERRTGKEIKCEGPVKLNMEDKAGIFNITNGFRNATQKKNPDGSRELIINSIQPGYASEWKIYLKSVSEKTSQAIDRILNKIREGSFQNGKELIRELNIEGVNNKEIDSNVKDMISDQYKMKGEIYG